MAPILRLMWPLRIQAVLIPVNPAIALRRSRWPEGAAQRPGSSSFREAQKRGYRAGGEGSPNEGTAGIIIQSIEYEKDF